MVALRGAEVERFLANAQPRIAVWLIHGSDQGLVDERVRAIAKSAVDDANDPLQVVTIEPDQISNGGLLDEWTSISLFASRRLLKVDLGARDIVEPIRLCLETPTMDCVLAIRAGQLKKDSALRLLCEKSRNAVAVECFSDSPSTIRHLVLEESQKHGVTIGDDALQILTETLGADRSSTRNEVSKLLAYAAENGHVAAEDVQAVVTGAVAKPGDMVVSAMIAGDLNRASTELLRAGLNSSDCQAIVASCMRLYLQIHRANAEIQAGAPVASAHERVVRTAGPMRRSVEVALTREDIDSTLTLVDILRDASARTRRDPGLAEMTAARAVWSIALRAARRAGR